MPVTGDRSSSRIPWLQIGIETFFIILGVLLALALDEWRQDRREREVVTLALRNLQDEIQANRKEVRRALAYHRDLLRRLEKTPDMDVAFQIAFVRNNAWQAAQSSQAAARMDFPLVAVFSRMEELQDQYQALIAGSMSSIYQSQDAQSARPILEDLAAWEEMLLRVYDEAERVIADD